MVEENEIPQRIIDRLNRIQDEVGNRYARACEVQITKIEKASFRFTHSAPSGILTKDERAQSVCFITKYENLNDVVGVHIEEKNGEYYLGNISFIRQVLNEYRPIIQNQRDSIFYMNIHKLIREKLQLRNPREGLVLSVINEHQIDISDVFLSYLNERVKTIRLLLNELDFNYIYNGILQHSDHAYTDRFLEEYNSGELNYVFFEHAFILRAIKQELFWHYKILNFLTFPKLGPL